MVITGKRWTNFRSHRANMTKHTKKKQKQKQTQGKAGSLAEHLHTKQGYFKYNTGGMQ